LVNHSRKNRVEATTSYVTGPVGIVGAEWCSPGIQGIVTSFVLKAHAQVGGVWVSIDLLYTVLANPTDIAF
jgi:hypothetical protein